VKRLIFSLLILTCCSTLFAPYSDYIDSEEVFKNLPQGIRNKVGHFTVCVESEKKLTKHTAVCFLFDLLKDIKEETSIVLFKDTLKLYVRNYKGGNGGSFAVLLVRGKNGLYKHFATVVFGPGFEHTNPDREDLETLYGKVKGTPRDKDGHCVVSLYDNAGFGGAVGIVI